MTGRDKKKPTIDLSAYDTLDKAHARIVALEEKLDEAIDIIIKRDALLEAHERRIVHLKMKLGPDETQD